MEISEVYFVFNRDLSVGYRIERWVFKISFSFAEHVGERAPLVDYDGSKWTGEIQITNKAEQQSACLCVKQLILIKKMGCFIKEGGWKEWECGWVEVVLSCLEGIDSAGQRTWVIRHQTLRKASNQYVYWVTIKVWILLLNICLQINVQPWDSRITYSLLSLIGWSV